MRHCSLIFAAWLFITQESFAILKPAEASLLHHTYVHFEDSSYAQVQLYTLELYLGRQPGVGATPVFTASAKLPVFKTENLEWGKQYIWRVKMRSASGERYLPVHSFEIRVPPMQSFDDVKLNVIQNKESEHAGGWLAIDYTRSIYNRSGQRIWCMPQIPGIVDEKTHIRDIKITKDNTITFLTIPLPVEIDFEGKVLWKAPFPFVYEGDTIIYHHEFFKTPRGTYMVLGDRKVWRKVPGAYGDEELKTEFDVKVVDHEVYKRVLLAVVLEFDREGQLVWAWDANRYVKDEDLNYKKTKRGFPNLATHANALRESSDGKKVYVGFRDLSRIVRIDRMTGKVEYSVGERYPSGEAKKGNGLFLNQHDAAVNKHGTMYVFNNNGSLNAVGVSSVLELKEPCGPKDSLLRWRFDLNFDTLSSAKSMNGGSVEELPNGNVLLCGGSLNRIFEVTKKKKIVWDAFIYARGKNDTTWQAMQQYRCRYIKPIDFPQFLASADTLTGLAGVQHLQVLLTNADTRAGQYQIEVFDGAGKLILATKSLPVQAGKSVYQTIKLPAGKKYHTIRVSKGGTIVVIPK